MYVLKYVFPNMHVCQCIEKMSQWIPIALLRTATYGEGEQVGKM